MESKLKIKTMKKSILLFFAAVAVFTACNNEITDEINNPAEVNVIYELIKGVEDNGSVTQYTRAMVFTDEYSMYDAIKDGGITLNDEELPFNEQTKTYFTDQEIMHDSLYTFQMTLSNGNKYTSSVRTPAKMFGTVMTNPAVYSTSVNLNIEWSDTIPDATVNIEFFGKPFNEAETILIFNTETEDDGSYVLNKNSLPSQYQDVSLENAYIRLSRLAEGNKSGAFSSEDIYVLFSYIAAIETE